MRFPTFLERDQNLSLVNTSRFKPQTRYEEIKVVWMIFHGKLLCRFQCQQSALFSSMYATDRHKEVVVTLKITTRLDRLGRPIF